MAMVVVLPTHRWQFVADESIELALVLCLKEGFGRLLKLVFGIVVDSLPEASQGEMRYLSLCLGE